MSALQPRKKVLLNSVTTTTTSSGFPVSSAGRLSLQLIATGVTSGTGTFTVDVSNSNENGVVTWTPYQRMIPNLTGTNAQTDAYVSSKVLNSTGSSMIFIPAGDTFESIRVTSTVATDGTYSAILYVN